METKSSAYSVALSDSTAQFERRALYLSGAPRLSTRANTESLGPRSHILGVINALRELGWSVDEFIVGDTTPDSIHGEGSEARMSASRLKLLAADIARLVYRVQSRAKLSRLVSRAEAPAISYERYALMQELGSLPKRAGSLWILEVNALLAIEATSERRATSSRTVAAWFERRTLRSADLIVAVTKNLASAIAETYAIPAERIVTVENGVDASVHHESTATPAAVPTIGFLGTLYAWQRVDELMSVLAASDDSGWHVRIAGSGPELAALQERARILGLEERVEFLGRVHPDDVPAFLQTVDICYAGHGSANGVYFSPLKLWEYLAAGRPVIASKHEATVRLAADGLPVLVFDDTESLHDALAHALRHRGELLEAAAAAQQLVWARHSWKSRVGSLLARVGVSSD